MHVLRGHKGAILSVGFSPDGNTVITGSRDGTVRLWDVKTGMQRQELKGYAECICSVAFSPDNNFVLAGTLNGEVCLWDLKARTEPQIFKGHTGAILSVSFSPDGSVALTGSRDGKACLWDVKLGELLLELAGHTDCIRSVAFSPDSTTVLTGSQDDTACVWDATEGTRLQKLTDHAGGVNSVAFSADGKTILTGSGDKRICLWKSSALCINKESGLHYALCSELEQDKECIIFLEPDKKERLIFSDAVPALILKGHTGGVNSVAFSPHEGKTILTASEDGTARLWNFSTGKELQICAKSAFPIISAVFSPDGKTVFAVPNGKIARDYDSVWLHNVNAGALYNDKTGGYLEGICAKMSFVISGNMFSSIKHTKRITSVAISANGLCVLTGSEDTTVCLRQFDKTGSEFEPRRLVAKGGVTSVALSCHSIALIGSEDKTAYLWDINPDNPNSLQILKGHTSRVTSVAFSPNGETALTGSWDGTARLWNVKTGEQLQICKGYTTFIDSVAFSPDGKTVLTGEGGLDSEDGIVCLWDVKTGERLQTFKGPYCITSVAFSPDGKAIVAGSADTTAWVWKIKGI